METVALSVNQVMLVLVAERIKDLDELYNKLSNKALTSRTPSLDDCSPSSLRRVKEMLELNKGVYEWVKRLEGNEIH
jgi:hypothetical protein